MTVADFGYPVYALWFYYSQNFKLFGSPIFRFWASPDECYSRMASCALNLTSTVLFLYHLFTRCTFQPYIILIYSTKLFILANGLTLLYMIYDGVIFKNTYVWIVSPMVCFFHDTISNGRNCLIRLIKMTILLMLADRWPHICLCS